MSISKTLRCAIYTRKSSEEGLEQEFNSLDAQRDSCAAYIESQAGEGWELVDSSYDDGGFSGGSMERPGLQKLLTEIGKNRIDVVVVYKVDRLTRSLTDFAKIVDAFDSNSVSFVSVTQAFNTTTSMGRLTLNVLLSFAQFEREVIGERIRDKIAASKKKGMWMGGVPPLGYDVKDRKLIVNFDEAKRVLSIYQRYLKLESVPELVDDLKKRGIRGKSWTTQKGVKRKGGFMARGALYRLLGNPVYLGRISHKEKSYPGSHEPIILKDLWDEAQALLSSQGGKRSRTLSLGHTNLLSGLLFDDMGNPMQHSHATKAGGRRYRYYVSKTLLNRNPGIPGSIPRVPAQAIEDLVKEHVLELFSPPLQKKWKGMTPGEQMKRIRNTVQRVELGANEVEMTLSKDDIDLRAYRMNQQHIRGEHIREKGDFLILRITIRLKTRGGEKIIQVPGGGSPHVVSKLDQALIRAVARAIDWREALENGEAESVSDLARKSGCTYHYVKRILKLSFLAPGIVEKILQGRQPNGLNLSQILRIDLPLSWKSQREVLGFTPEILG
jgi:DNA invertase Pin-like site-specific DNA recombinase